MLRAYSQSKLALMMTTFALAERLSGTGVTANVVHPGLVATGLVRCGGLVGMVWRALATIALSPEQGAEQVLYAALAPELRATTGTYFKNHNPARPNPAALNPALREQVWAATEQLVALQGRDVRGRASAPAS
jgi:NAD(P)-dependent dehydrogenase (short-subunit alcohol dehydrogenase family)